MLKKILILVIISYITLYASNQKIESVVVSGMGINQDGAIKNATKTAIQQVVGMYVVTDSLVKNRKLIKDEVITHSNAYLKSFKLLNSEKDEDGLVVIEAKVKVEVGKLTKTLNNLNIATKGVNNNVKAIAFDKISNSKNFKKMAKKIIIDPIIENKGVYDIKIESITPLDDFEAEYFSNENCKNKIKNFEVSPLEIKINVEINKDYLNSVNLFLKNSSKDVERFLKTDYSLDRLTSFYIPSLEKIDKNYIEHIVHIVDAKNRKKISGIGNEFILDTSYILSPKNSKILSYLFHKYLEPKTINFNIDIYNKKNEIINNIQLNNNWARNYDETTSISHVHACMVTNKTRIYNLDYNPLQSLNGSKKNFYINTPSKKYIIYFTEDEIKEMSTIKASVIIK